MTTQQQRARVLAVTSGKGGVGKSNVSTNLAIALARAGHRVCVFDADTGLANVNVLLDLRPDLTLEHLLNGDADIDDIVVRAPGGIDIVPAASGIAALTRLDMAEQARLLDALHTLESRYDFLVVDTAAGIGSTVTLFLHSVQHCLLIVTPEPTSLTDAFALLKVLHRQRCDTTVHVLTNMVDGYRSSIDVYKRLANACERYLGTRPEYIGYIPADKYLRKAVQQQKPVITQWPGAPSSQSFMALGRSLGELLQRKHRPGRFTRFWETLLERRRERPLASGKGAALT
ncbi:MAG: MinD/ParA family protein, partial [Pseudomonadota bacterium]